MRPERSVGTPQVKFCSIWFPVTMKLKALVSGRPQERVAVAESSVMESSGTLTAICSARHDR